MDCRNYRELLDSYLSGELPVETNHSVRRHAAECAACRAETAARRALRAALGAAVRQEAMSAEAVSRLRARVRAEADAGGRRAGRAHVAARGNFFSRLFPFQIPLAVAAAALVFIAAYTLLPGGARPAYASELSPAFIAEAAGDHDHCAAQHRDLTDAVTHVNNARDYHAAFADLHTVAAAHAAGLRLRAAHVCGFAGRRFVHLVYTRGDGQLISLLVGARDARAIKGGAVPDDDGLSAGLQSALADRYSVSAYQTARHVVLVVSQVDAAENARLAERLARPVSEHVRRIEANQPRTARVQTPPEKSGEAAARGLPEPRRKA